MTDDTHRPGSPDDDRRRWRDDPLSIFLAVSAVLLAGMYALEQRDLSTLEASSARAQTLSASLQLTSCTAGAASADGTTLAFSCQRPPAAVVAELEASRSELSAYDEIAVAGPTEIITCTTTGVWPDDCRQRQRPTRADVAEAKRGARPGN